MKVIFLIGTQTHICAHISLQTLIQFAAENIFSK